MLNVWKNAWRKAQSAAATSGQDNNGEPQPSASGASWSAASVDAVPAVPPQNGEGPVSAEPTSILSQTRKLDQVDGWSSVPPDRPVKRRRDTDGTPPEATNGSFQPESAVDFAPPRELVVSYESSKAAEETPLTNQLRALDPDGRIGDPWFRYVHYILSDLGPCGADLVWRHALLDRDLTIPEHSAVRQVEAKLAARPINDERFLKVVQDWTFSNPLLDSAHTDKNVSDKFVKLVRILKSYEPYRNNLRAVIFVQRRVAAVMILKMLSMLPSPLNLDFIRPQVLVNHDMDQQRSVMDSFANGQCNLLIATKSMEDLDIPKADVVIRFDLFESQISYAYARACLRGPEACLIHMVEEGNDVHRRILSALSPKTDAMKSWLMGMRNRSAAFPPAGLHETTDPYRSDDEDNDDLGPCVVDPSTSSRIYHRDATAIVLRFVSKLSEHLGKELFIVRESVKAEPKTYRVIIWLHGYNPIQGEYYESLAHARRSACYKVCQELSDRGHLDYRILPRPPYPSGIYGPARSAPEVNKSNGTRRYPRKSPDFWANCRSVGWSRVFPTIIWVDDGNTPTHGHIVLLTRLPLPPLSSTKVFYTGVPATVYFTRAASFTMDGPKLQQVYHYTTRLCRGIMNKSLDCPLENMPYLLLPLNGAWKHGPKDHNSEASDIQKYIPWDLVYHAAQNFVTPFRYESIGAVEEDVKDAVVQDRWVEFTRRYEVEKVRTDLSPLSKPVDSPRESAYESFLEYCKARRKDFDGLKSHTQPLIQIKRLSAVLNRLNPTTRPLTESSKATAKYLIPELCAKYTIPASTFRTALLLPSITRRIDDMLLVKELNAKIFDHSLQEDLLHTAITAPAAGFEFDYERLELLGDAYLKYLSSVYLFVTNPEKREGALHFARQRIISNKSLLEYADSAGLPPFIQSKPFVAKLWQPAPLEAATSPDEASVGNASAAGAESNTSVVPPKRSKRKRQQDDQHIQWLGDKAVADVAEAIIGAGYITGGREVALKVTKALNIPVPRIDRWSDFGRKALAVAPEAVSKLGKGSIEAVERIIGHKFQRPQFLAQALTHASIQGYDLTSYERLEFLGDAILDFMVIRHLYYRETQLSPGGLTLLKGAMVSNSALAAVCVWSGLHKHLLFESRDLANGIQAYEVQLKAKQEEEYRLAREEGRSPGQYWLDIEPPKALSDVVESIIGAVYISDNFSPVGSETLFVNVLKPFYDKHITLKTLSHHPTKILFELFQAEGCHEFEMLKQQVHPERSSSDGRTGGSQQITRCEVIVHDTILAAAESATTLSASRMASFFALDALEGDSEFMKRTCDCRSQSQARKAVKKALKDMWEDDGNDEEVEAADGRD
ncbi:hypothetical protein GLOTRDRAFT_136195 [Gloeophyllum trabeum ATCC 11539]|uniref:Uncharacterized protein n=1 Tax=Gloeophyllum trabeum (strain ATCC 11539 / FP-39264 / Madison 617) TaxID=670483 RepID=S7S0L9_GLOTA|nr:uncharacterized protein GLOTRDRAFT_136195 [Gloeophyllum trabeum ATCC 11539]EPQ59279.1 hypothetical protein GLOTRDRAFT_136195 [Gloeophyllum trabeum ATCC 11539]